MSTSFFAPTGLRPRLLGVVAYVDQFCNRTGETIMRTPIDIDGARMAEPLNASGFGTKEATVDEGLRPFVCTRQ